MRRSSIRAGVVGLTLLVGLGGGMGQADAAILEFHTFESPFTPGVDNQGWWSEDFPNADINTNYLAGFAGSEIRNFFSFDLSSLADPVSSATLELTLYRVDRSSVEPFIYSLFDVSTDPAVLNFNVGTSAAIFADLGTGVTYGSLVLDRASGDYSSEVISIPLNAAALIDINNATGFYSIGGRLTAGTEFIFGSSFSTGTQRLVVDTTFNGNGTVIPEPSSVLLLGTGLLGMLGFRRRQS